MVTNSFATFLNIKLTNSSSCFIFLFDWQKSNRQPPVEEKVDVTETDTPHSAPQLQPQPAVNREVSTSPQLPVRKRRRKHISSSEQEEYR